MTRLVTLVAAIAIGFPVLANAVRPDCEPARCAVQSAIARDCSCEGSTNHGRYVSCVAHVVKRLSHDGLVPTNCKGKVTRCAARSICGKAGFVTCQIPTDTCDLTTGFCVDDPAIACLTDLDCGAKCKIKSSAEGCMARGGVPSAAANCCAGCGGSPSGAFLDGVR
jgi:hypothetical protein